MIFRVVAAVLAAQLVLTSPAFASSPRSSETIVMPLSGMGEPGEKPVYWDFKLDAGRGAGQWTRIRVPSNWEQEGFGRYYYGTEGRGRPDSDPIIPKETGEYRTSFVAPAEWRGRNVRIVFEGVMTDTKVLVNGRSAGEIHQGGFYRFNAFGVVAGFFGAVHVAHAHRAKAGHSHCWSYFA